MEKKLPEDNLERFLRSSFEDYKQEPSDKVWGLIEAGLEAKPVFVKRIKPWMYWSAAASVLGIIILFQFKSNQSLNKKLDAVLKENQMLSNPSAAANTDIKTGADSEKLNNPATDPKENKVIEPKTSEKPIDGTLTPAMDPANHAVVLNPPKTIEPGQKENQKIKDIKPSGQEKTNHLKEKDLRERKDLNPQNTGGKTGIVSSSNRSAPENSTSNQQPADNPTKKPLNHPSETKITAKDLAVMDKAGEIKSDPSPVTAEVINSKSDEKASELSPLSRPNYSIISIQRREALPESTSAQKSLDIPGGWMNPIPVNLKVNRAGGIEWGIFGGLLKEKGEITPKRMFDPRITDFPKNEYVSSNSWQTGIELSKPLGSAWSVSGGVGFKHFEFINELTQSLAFKNREKPNPGNLPFQHDFKCKIPGPSGTSDIIINSEQLDSRASISDAEQIKITVKNQSKLNYLTLPLSLAFQIHKGKWSVFAKTGLLADIYLSRTVDEPQITLSHPQLQLRHDKPVKPRVGMLHANPVVMNGMVSAGIKYQLGSLWSVSLSPGLILPFTPREINKDIQVDSRIYSLQMGIQFSLNSL